MDDEKWPMGSKPGIIPDREAEWRQRAEKFSHYYVDTYCSGNGAGRGGFWERVAFEIVIFFQRWLAERGEK